MNHQLKVAFLILAHTDPEHLFKLVNALGYECDIFIHLDKKSEVFHFSKNIKQKNVSFIDNRVEVSWAGISMIDAQMNLIEETLKFKEKYSHVVFLSGSDYPIKKMDYILNYFSSQSDREFIKFIDMRESPEHYMKLINQKWFKEPFIRRQNKILISIDKGIRFLLNKIKFRNNWTVNIIPYFGSQWIALSLDCAQYVYDFHNQNYIFRKFNKFTFSPDEHYIHTIIGNSKYSKFSMGLQPFGGRGTFRLANYHLIDKSLNKWYTIDDYNLIEQSDKLFLRKIRSYDGNGLIKKINAEILKIS
jgi:hypothetical protein